MRLERLELSNFRNFKQVRVEFSEGLSVFVGPNGHGKSNLLETLHLVLTGESFRLAKPCHLVGRGGEIAHVGGEIFTHSRHHRVTLQVEKKKIFLLDEKRVHQVRLRQQFGAIVFSPDSLQAIKGGPELRRQWMDQVVLFAFPEGAGAILDYKKALKYRNSVLREYVQKKISLLQAQQVLKAIQPRFLECAENVVKLRQKAIECIKPTFHKVFCEMVPRATADIKYRVGEREGPSQEVGRLELQLGRTLTGPHTHDLAFFVEGQEARFFCSQGDQRSLILAFKMAQLLYHMELDGACPVLLLDDVFSELDEQKREYLVDILKWVGAQTFLTTTDFREKSFFRGHNVEVFPIWEGMIREKNEWRSNHAQ